jgi:hypothetical protein
MRHNDVYNKRNNNNDDDDDDDLAVRFAKLCDYVIQIYNCACQYAKSSGSDATLM